MHGTLRTHIISFADVIDPTKLLKTPTFKAPQALMPKFKA